MSLSFPNLPLLQFSLTADWPTWELSPVQEAAVYLADELADDNTALLWEFVEMLEDSRQVLDQAVTGSKSFQEDQHDAVWALTLAQTSSLLHPLSHSLMHLYLGIRAYSPTLELHRSLRKGPAFDSALASATSDCHADSTSWAVISPGEGLEETVVCSPKVLDKVLAKGTPIRTCG